MKPNKDIREYLVVGIDDKGVRNWSNLFARSRLEAIVKGKEKMKIKDVSWVFSTSQMKKASTMNIKEMYNEIYGT